MATAKESTTQAILDLPASAGGEGAAAADESAKDEVQGTEAAAEGTSEASAEGEQQQATPEGQQQSESAAEGQAEAKTAEADIEVTLPEGVNEDAELLGSFKALAKEHGLTSDKAQKYVDLFVGAQKRAEEQQREQLAQQAEAWAEAAKADKEFGGAKLPESTVLARKALARFGTQELQQLFAESGLGNHPELVRLFYRVGKEISEDSISGAHGSGPTASGADAVLRAMYPTMFQQDSKE